MIEERDAKQEQYNADRARETPKPTTNIVPIRISAAMLANIRAAIASANLTATLRSGEPYDLSRWIRKAIEEKLAHLQRRRNGAGAKRTPKLLDTFGDL